MANLKLIKVTGSPFCSTLYGCIGIQVNDNNFNVIKGGDLKAQSSYSGGGWEYATAEEIAENWKLIYPHWTPEPGDNVIITQDYGSWANQRGTIVERSSSEGYWRVKRLPDDRVESFDYTCQMILAPTTSSTSTVTETKSESPIGWQWQDLKVGDNVRIIGGDSSYRPIGAILTIDRIEPKDYKGPKPIRVIGSDEQEKGWPTIGTFEPYYGDIKPSKPKEKTMSKFQIGDRVKCITLNLKGYGKTGTVRVKSSNTSDTSVGVEFDEDIDGHALDGRCRMNYGWWVFEKDLELISDSKPKGETVNVRFLTEQEFRDQDLWRKTYPKGWNSEGMMNKYLGQSIVLIKSSIRSDGSFTYEGWTFQLTDYLITDGVVGSKSSVYSKPEPRFKVGDKVTYKSTADCGGSYAFGGVSRSGRVGEVEAYLYYQPEQGCYKITVSSGTPSDCSYSMLESEFEEFDPSYSGTIHVPECSTAAVLTIPTGSTTFSTGSTSSDPLDVYHQNPITIKKKPKTKLTITTI